MHSSFLSESKITLTIMAYKEYLKYKNADNFKC